FLNGPFAYGPQFTPGFVIAQPIFMKMLLRQSADHNIPISRSLQIIRVSLSKRCYDSLYFFHLVPFDFLGAAPLRQFFPDSRVSQHLGVLFTWTAENFGTEFESIVLFLRGAAKFGVYFCTGIGAETGRIEMCVWGQPRVV